MLLLLSKSADWNSKKKLPRSKIKLEIFFVDDRIGIEALKEIVVDLLTIFFPLIERNHPFIVA